MDILTHTLSGVAVATCAAAFVPKVRTKASLLLVGAVAGAFPDLDAISLWSRFDGTIGKLFGLGAKGSSIYGAKFWYSHHAFFHSLLGSLLFGSLLILLLFVLNKSKTTLVDFIRSKYLFFVTFVFAYWAHLLGDLPTPASVWGGIGFFWPSTDYIGGTGKIWWWNNYDIFLLIVCCILVNLSLLSAGRFLKNKVRKLISASFVLFFMLIIFQINTRHYNYAYAEDSSKYGEMELNSKKEQERILGKRIYNMMDAFDRKMKFHF